MPEGFRRQGIWNRWVIKGAVTVALLGIVLGAGLTVGQAAAEGGIIAADRALDRARAGEVVLIDVRRPSEWRQTGVPAQARQVTIHGPGGMAGFVAAMRKTVGGDLDRPVALICARGGRSTRAQDALMQAGFTRVLNVKEGVLGGPNGTGWIKRVLPLERCKGC